MKEDRLVYLVPYAHLDTQWRWEYPTTITKYLRNTLVENFDLLKRYPDYEFNFTGAIRYRMMKEYYPELFVRLKELILEGRWHLAGTCLEETDTIVPSVESMVRNALYGDRWQRGEFETSSRDTLLPDCFGFPGNMPTVLAHAGVIGFSTQKLKWGSAVGIPFEVGLWRGPDGSELPSALNPGMYVSHLPLPVHLNPARLARLRRLGKENGVWKSFQYYGVGDIGGSPSEGSVKRARRSMRRGRVRQGASDQFFAELTSEELQRLDRYEGDLLLTEHSAGSLTSAAIMKRWNRRNEQLAFAAEAASVAALITAGLPYPRNRIESAWWRVIGSQMHDILPGTCTPTAYAYAHNDEVLALTTWREIIHDAAEAIAPHRPGTGELLLFNPIAEERSDVVEIEAPEGLTEAGSVVVRDDSGSSYLGQFCSGEEGRRTLLLAPTLAGFAWQRFSIEPADRVEAPHGSSEHRVHLDHTGGEYVLINEVYRVIVSDDGALTSIVDLRRGLELLARPFAYELQREHPKGYPAWNMDWRDRKRTPVHRIAGGGRVEVIEKGPVRVGLRVTTHFGSSLLVREIRLAAGSDLVEITEHIEWRERGYSLKVALSLPGPNPRVTTNWESSRVERPVNNRRAYEFPSRYWADLSTESSSVSIIEDCKYGYDRPEPATLRMTLLYTPGLRALSAFRDQDSQDWGNHLIRYALRAHSGDLVGTDRAARRFNQPIQAFRLGTASGAPTAAEQSAPSSPAATIAPSARPPQPPDHAQPVSMVRISDRRLGILALKLAEDGAAVLVRLHNRTAEEVSASVQLGFPVARASRVTGLEESLGPMPVVADRVEVEVGPNGLFSFVAEFADGSLGNDHPAAVSIDLPRDTRLFARVEESAGSGHSLLPVELMPTELRCGTVSFQLAAGDGPNALCCRSQRIELPASGTRLSLLATAIEATQANFRFFAGAETLSASARVGTLTGFLGQWDFRLWKRPPQHEQRLRRDYIWANRCIGVEPGYVKRDRLAWYSTHTHEGGADRPYSYGYLYRIDLELPPGCTAVELPDDPRLLVVAATVTTPALRVDEVRVLGDRFDF